MHANTTPTAWDIATDLGWINTETIEKYTSHDNGDTAIYRREDGATLTFSLTHNGEGRVDGYTYATTDTDGFVEVGGDSAEDSADATCGLRELLTNWAAA